MYWGTSWGFTQFLLNLTSPWHSYAIRKMTVRKTFQEVFWETKFNYSRRLLLNKYDKFHSNKYLWQFLLYNSRAMENLLFFAMFSSHIEISLISSILIVFLLVVHNSSLFTAPKVTAKLRYLESLTTSMFHSLYFLTIDPG